MVALGESQPDRLLEIPLPAGSLSSKLAPATVGISHMVQRATVLQPHPPRVDETGGTRSGRYRGELFLPLGIEVLTRSHCSSTPSSAHAAAHSTIKYRAYVTLSRLYDTTLGELSSRSPRSGFKPQGRAALMHGGGQISSTTPILNKDLPTS